MAFFEPVGVVRWRSDSNSTPARVSTPSRAPATRAHYPSTAWGFCLLAVASQHNEEQRFFFLPAICSLVYGALKKVIVREKVAMLLSRLPALLVRCVARFSRKKKEEGTKKLVISLYILWCPFSLFSPSPNCVGLTLPEVAYGSRR